jgi:hypothetical protein
MKQEEPKSAVWLDKREQELLVIMKWIDSFKGFDLKPGRLTIDFNSEGKIAHFNVSQTHDGIFIV